jgi:sporulation protein YlmC with PRC-barrel domain
VTLMSSRELRGKKVWSQDGREVGEIDGLEISPESWAVLGFDIKVRRDVLEEMHLKKPLMGTQTVRVTPDEVSGMSDAVILKSRLDAIAHTGGKPAKE